MGGEKRENFGLEEGCIKSEGFLLKTVLSGLQVEGTCPRRMVPEYEGEVKATLRKGEISLKYSGYISVFSLQDVWAGFCEGCGRTGWAAILCPSTCGQEVAENGGSENIWLRICARHKLMIPLVFSVTFCL